MSESGILADKLQLLPDEKLLTKFETNIKLLIDKGGIFGKKWLVGDNDSSIPAFVAVMSRRIIFLAQYTTQRKLVVALVVPIPTGKKHEHALYGELDASAYQSTKIGFLGGATLTFAAHGTLQRQYPGYTSYLLCMPDVTKKLGAALEELMRTLKPTVFPLPNSGRCELE